MATIRLTVDVVLLDRKDQAPVGAGRYDPWFLSLQRQPLPHGRGWDPMLPVKALAGQVTLSALYRAINPVRTARR